MSEVLKFTGANVANLPENLAGGDGDHPPHAPLVDLLQRLTALAQRGQLRGIGVVMVENGDVIADTWLLAPDVSGHLLMAGASYLQQRLAVAGNREN